MHWTVPGMADSQLIGILIAAMVAGVVLFRLYVVLGRRTGHEDSRALAPAPLRDARTLPQPQPESVTPTPANGLLEIELADHSFDRDHFLGGARTAYEMIQKAFAEGDRVTLRPLLSDDVYAAFDREIAARAGAPDRVAAVTDARIVGAALHGQEAEITVDFRANFTGADGALREVADHWTFARAIGAADPNWTLVATAGAMP